MHSVGRIERPPLLITRTAAFIAVAVLAGYALAPVPNVELVTATCFVAGVLLGPLAGVSVGVLAEAIFAGLHPMGGTFGLMLAAQCAGMGAAGLFGALASVFCKSSAPILNTAIIVAFGVIATLTFDLLTNLAFPISAGFSVSQTAASMLLALPFAAIHLLSNTLIFAVVVAPILPRLKKLVLN